MDGKVSELGAIDGGRLLQAKGMTYTVEALLADPEKAQAFLGGTFLTLYLAPRDYHRIQRPSRG